jgi:transposase InsO family protein
MRGVLLVNGLGANLYSIGTATATGIEVLFTNDTVSFTRNGIARIEGRRAGKTLYHLNIQARNHTPKITTALRATKLLPLSIWHRRFGHVNNKTLLKMASLGCTNGLALFNDGVSTFCEGCVMGKMQRLPFKHGHEKATVPGQRIHSDICGPIQVTTPSGNRYFATFKDDYSNYCTTNLLKKKSEVTTALQNFVAKVKMQIHKDVKCIRSDNGGEYLNGELQEWLNNEGISHERSAPYTPQQNGVAERTNRTLMEAARSMLYEKKVPLELWGEAVMCATHIQNRKISGTNDVTPFELWTGSRPDVSYLRVFGSPAFVHIPDETRRKLDPKAVECLLVGYCEHSKAFRMWNPVTRKIIISRDVVFREDATYESGPINQTDYDSLFPLDEVTVVNIFFGLFYEHGNFMHFYF